MKTIFGLGLGILLAATCSAQAQTQSASVTKMADQLVALEQQGVTPSTPRWGAMLSRYNFIDPTPLSEIRPAPGLEGYKITQTMYGAEDEVFPSAFILYKGDSVVAFLGLENRPNNATTTTNGYPIFYTSVGQKLSAQEKAKFESWFYTWLNSVN